MEWLTSPEIWIAFFTLTALEIVLGIDNIIMISILVGRMPKHMQPRTRFFGLALAENGLAWWLYCITAAVAVFLSESLGQNLIVIT